MPTRLMPERLRRRFDWTWPALAMLLTGLVVSAWTAVVSPLLLPKRLRDDGPPLRAVVVAVMLTGAGLAFIERERSSAYYRGNRLARFLEATSDGVIAATRAGRISYANRAAQGMFRRDSLEGLPLESLMPTDARAAHRQALIRYLNTGRKGSGFDRPISMVAMRFDGQEFLAAVTVSEGGEEPYSLWAVIRDQTPEVTAAHTVATAAADVLRATTDAPGEATGNVAD